MRIPTLVLSLLVAIFGAASVKADYPDRPVRIIVPVAAGGGVDVMARMLAQKLSERWNQQFVVEIGQARPALSAARR
jgi:tripartite-type tricarboxylate transporter receptor subunit TctC